MTLGLRGLFGPGDSLELEDDGVFAQLHPLHGLDVEHGFEEGLLKVVVAEGRLIEAHHLRGGGGTSKTLWTWLKQIGCSRASLRRMDSGFLLIRTGLRLGGSECTSLQGARSGRRAGDPRGSVQKVVYFWGWVGGANRWR